MKARSSHKGAGRHKNRRCDGNLVRWLRRGLLCVVSLMLGCQASAPQIIIHTRVVEATASHASKDITRVVREVVTATPMPATPTPAPPVVQLYVAPQVNGAPERQRSYGQLVAWLEAHTRLHVRLVEPKAYAESIAALCERAADVAVLTAPAYLMAHEACGAEAAFTAVRNGSVVQRAQIVVQSDQWRNARGLSPLRSVRELDGLTFGFTEPGSPTGYLLPKVMLAEAGATPRSQVFLAGDAQAMLAVYRGEVDAAACEWSPPREDGSPGDARIGLLEAYPEILRATKVIRLSAPMPNEPLVFRKDLPIAVRQELLAAFGELSRSEEGRRLLYEVCRWAGLAPASDSDYEAVRRMVRAYQFSLEQLVD